MVEIMRDPGENSAADRTVALKASMALLGENRRGNPVNVSINNRINNQLFTPG